MEKKVSTVGKISLVDKALAKHSSMPTSESVLKALELKKAKDEEEESQKILKALERIDSNTKEGVRILQGARKIEKASKEFLKEIAEAEENFLKNVDFELYNKKVTEARQKLAYVYSVYCAIHTI